MDMIGDTADQAEVMADQDQRHAEARPEIGQQLENLRRHGRVERGRRLVGDQYLRIAGNRHRDGDALPLASGEFVRIVSGPTLRLVDPDVVQQFDRAIPGRTAAQTQAEAQHGSDLRPDGEKRIERRLRLLEDDRHRFAADAIELAAFEADQVLTFEQHLAANACARWQQAEPGEHRDALARAALPDDRRGLATPHGEAEIVHRVDRAEGDTQILKPEKRVLRHRSMRLASQARRSASPSCVAAISVMARISAGKTSRCSAL